MVTKSDVVIYLGEKACMKMLSEAVGKAASYYQGHIDLTKEVLAALKKSKEIKARVDILKKQVSEQNKVVNAVIDMIPASPELPKPDAKSWGKKKQIKTYKEALTAYSKGASTTIANLRETRKYAEAALNDLKKNAAPKLDKKLFDEKTAGKSKDGNVDTTMSIVSGNAWGDMIEIQKTMNRDLNSTISKLKKLESTYLKTMKASEARWRKL